LLLLLALGLGGCQTARVSSPATGAAEPDAVVQRRAEAHAHFAQGVLLEQARKPEAALEEYHKAAELDPANEELVADISRRWLVQKQPERALDLLKSAASQPGASALVDVLLGTAYAQTGKTNLAITANQRAIAKNPGLLAAHQNLHANYYQWRRTNDAMAVLDRAAKVREAPADFLVGLAESYVNFASASPDVKSNAYPKAVALLKQAAAMSITNLHTRIRLADGFNVLGERDAAAKLYESLLTDFPQAPVLQENLRAKLTDIYLRGKDPKRAVEQLEMILKRDALNVQAHYYLAMLVAQAGDAAKAADHYGSVVTLNPKFEQAYYDLASAQLSAGRTNEVFRTLADAQKRFGENFVSEFLLGIAHARVGKYDEAVRRYTSAEVIARASDSKRLTPLFYFQTGSALERKGDYSEAVKYLQKALELNPDFPEAANYLGYMWAERGENLERAKALIEQAVKANPTSDAYLDSLAWVLFKLGKPREALEQMLKAVAIAEAEKKPDATLYDHLGDIHFALGDREKARAAWGEALKLGPNEDIRKKLEAAN
jgi:tetratricopeptide (TPR) repeat protein